MTDHDQKSMKPAKLVLRALKELRIARGFKESEVINYLGLQEDRRMQRCVATALRRMADLGVVTKEGGRYALDTKSLAVLEARRRKGGSSLCKPRKSHSRRRSSRRGKGRKCSCGKRRHGRSRSRRRRSRSGSKGRCGKKRRSRPRRHRSHRKSCGKGGRRHRRRHSGGKRRRRGGKKCSCGKRRSGGRRRHARKSHRRHRSKRC